MDLTQITKDVELMGQKYNLEPSDHNLEELHEVGILDDISFNSLRFERQNKQDSAQKAKELKQLEELKRKYNL